MASKAIDMCVCERVSVCMCHVMSTCVWNSGWAKRHLLNQWLHSLAGYEQRKHELIRMRQSLSLSQCYHVSLPTDEDSWWWSRWGGEEEKGEIRWRKKAAASSHRQSVARRELRWRPGNERLVWEKKKEQIRTAESQIVSGGGFCDDQRLMCFAEGKNSPASSSLRACLMFALFLWSTRHIVLEQIFCSVFPLLSTPCGGIRD